MILDELKGRIVLIKLRSHEELETFGIPSANVYAKVIEVDERAGIWVENPRWVPRKAGQAQEGHLTQVLIRWEYIVGIMTFPQREGPGEDDEIKQIGFVPE